MNLDKKFLLCAVAILIVSMIQGFVVHAVILAGDYESLIGVMRSEEESGQYMHWMLIAHVFLAIGITWLYRQGHDSAKPWLGQGVRFGLAFAVAATIPIYLIYHAVAQFPLDLALKQCVLETASVIVLGITAAAIHK